MIEKIQETSTICKKKFIFVEVAIEMCLKCA
jgi:hypothetical protein